MAEHKDKNRPENQGFSSQNDRNTPAVQADGPQQPRTEANNSERTSTQASADAARRVLAKHLWAAEVVMRRWHQIRDSMLTDRVVAQHLQAVLRAGADRVLINGVVVPAPDDKLWERRWEGTRNLLLIYIHPSAPHLHITTSLSVYLNGIIRSAECWQQYAKTVKRAWLARQKES